MTVAQTRWAGGLIARLSDQQLAAAFGAANYTPAEVCSLIASVRSRANQLVNLRDAG